MMTAPFLTDTAFHLIAAAPAQFGHLGVAVAGNHVVGVSIGHRSDADAAGRLKKFLASSNNDPGVTAEADEQLLVDTLDRIVQFLNGAKDNFADVPISLEHLSPFQRRVVAACRAIPRGGTKSYGLLAAAAGSPGAARAVGQVMATNRYPILVPCHRVVAAGGRLGGFSAPQGLSLKRQLLAFEASVADNEFRLSPARPPRKAARP
jgi:methylated-DNA-[protein]-cysteine S-methyltransferase